MSKSRGVVDEQVRLEKLSRKQDSLEQLSSHIDFVALKLSIFYFMVWFYNQLSWRMYLKWWTFLPCYILYDFCSYWAHRISLSFIF